MARKDNMARTKKHVPEFSKPATRPCDAYALRYPLPYCESADDSSDATESFDEQRYLEANTNKLLEELMQSGVDTLETKADYSSDATESFDEQRNHAEMMAWNSSDNVHPNVQLCRAIRKRKQQVTEAVDAEIQVQARSGVDSYTQMAKKRTRFDVIELARRSDVNCQFVQVQARSGVDSYTQMAKKMRLRRRSNEK